MVDLSGESLQIPDRLFQVKWVKDVRAYQKSIGQLPHAKTKSLQQAELGNGVETHLYSFLSKKLEKSFEGQMAVEMLVYKLELGELNTSDGDTAWAKVSLGFRPAKSKGVLRKERIYHALVGDTGPGLQTGHARRIVQALRQCLSSYNSDLIRFALEDEEIAKFLSLETLQIKENKVRGLEINSFVDPLKEAPKKFEAIDLGKTKAGMYHSFVALQNNTPSNGAYHLRMKSEEHGRVIDVNSGSRDKDGLCFIKDGEAYVNAGLYKGTQRYVKVLKTGTYWAWIDDVYDEENEYKTVVALGSTYDPDCVCMDTRTGQFFVLNRRGLTLLLSEVPKIQTQYQQEGAKGESYQVQLDYIVKANQMLQKEAK